MIIRFKRVRFCLLYILILDWTKIDILRFYSPIACANVDPILKRCNPRVYIAKFITSYLNTTTGKGRHDAPQVQVIFHCSVFYYEPQQCLPKKIFTTCSTVVSVFLPLLILTPVRAFSLSYREDALTVSLRGLLALAHRACVESLWRKQKAVIACTERLDYCFLDTNANSYVCTTDILIHNQIQYILKSYTVFLHLFLKLHVIQSVWKLWINYHR